MKFQILTLVAFFLAVFSVASFAEVTYKNALKVEDFDMGNMLTWSTSTEVNNKAFEIEKSTDGASYATIGKVKGAVNAAEEQEYRFMDVSAGQGITYYRLKQIDMDGKATYSAVVYSEKETANNFTIVAMTPPSEEDNIFEVTINAISEEELDYKIFDMKGAVVYTQKQKLKKGINVISVDLSAINSDMGFAGNNELLGDKVGYRLSLKGTNEAEMLTIAPRNKDVKSTNAAKN
jgi:hypothetical protein